MGISGEQRVHGNPVEPVQQGRKFGGSSIFGDRSRAANIGKYHRNVNFRTAGGKDVVSYIAHGGVFTRSSTTTQRLHEHAANAAERDSCTSRSGGGPEGARRRHVPVPFYKHLTPHLGYGAINVRRAESLVVTLRASLIVSRKSMPKRRASPFYSPHLRATVPIPILLGTNKFQKIENLVREHQETIGWRAGRVE